MLITQFVGFPAALAFGWLGKKIGPRAGIFIAIGVYTATALYAYFLDSEREFYTLAIVIGLVQEAFSRYLVPCSGGLVPEGKAGEFLGSTTCWARLRRFSGLC